METATTKNKIKITKAQERFVLASFTERYYSAVSTQGKFKDFQYTLAEGYESYDAICKAVKSDKTCLVEFKVRDFASTLYDSALIDAKKYWFLVNRYLQTGEIPIYYCFYIDGVALAFDLRMHLELEWEETTTYRYTMNKSAGKYKKQVGKLPYSTAFKFEYNIPDKEVIKKRFYSLYAVA